MICDIITRAITGADLEIIHGQIRYGDEHEVIVRWKGRRHEVNFCPMESLKYKHLLCSSTERFPAKLWAAIQTTLMTDPENRIVLTPEQVAEEAHQKELEERFGRSPGEKDLSHLNFHPEAVAAVLQALRGENDCG